MLGNRLRRPLAVLLLTAFSLPALADGFITRLLNKPVPGGVAVVVLPEQAEAPRATFQGKPLLTIREDGQRWIAIVDWAWMYRPASSKSIWRTVASWHSMSAHASTPSSTSP